jgi:hypothetical protein
MKRKKKLFNYHNDAKSNSVFQKAIAQNLADLNESNEMVNLGIVTKIYISNQTSRPNEIFQKIS